MAETPEMRHERLCREAAEERAMLRDARRALDDFDRNGGATLDEIKAEIEPRN